MRSKALRRFCCVLLMISLWACTDAAVTLEPVPLDGVILAFGNSLTFGTGAQSYQAYPAVLEELTGRKVVNSGIPGETSTEGADRLPGVLAEYRPHLVILCEGGNDMLRSMPDRAIAANLSDMLATIKAFGAQAVLIGVPRPKLLSSTPDFYREVAESEKVPYLEETLENILTQRKLKSDLIHPNAAGYRILAQEVADLLEQAGAIQ